MSLRPQIGGDGDDDSVFIVVAYADLPDPPMTLDERSEWMMAAHRLIQTKTKPRLEYHPIDRLLAAPGLSAYSVRRSYLPIEVTHSTEVRDARTNEPVSLWPASDLAAVKQRFERAMQSLAASKEVVQLQSTLASVAIPPRIDKIVAFAWDTMDYAGNYITRSMAQHALALAIRDFLANSDITGGDGEGAGGIRCYAQDPIYTPVDERVLSEAGFAIVDDPRAFLEVDEASVIIAMNPDIPLRQIIPDLARPAIMIWNKVTADNGNVVNCHFQLRTSFLAATWLSISERKVQRRTKWERHGPGYP
ncbi:hypothetical protein N658DRAFT_221454 [Parathielavia hyrcaniae]|uniref:SRR1-like domain-containing protein n=1 Tax=Parathielavia hyrcaniae TaxID=113614 RepID=A0AAN6SZC8_9PEZI|nr:hypothetical protein N658DRAFT_221454 [Parathielavia hyrcaniae]